MEQAKCHGDLKECVEIVKEVLGWEKGGKNERQKVGGASSDPAACREGAGEGKYMLLFDQCTFMFSLNENKQFNRGRWSGNNFKIEKVEGEGQTVELMNLENQFLFQFSDVAQKFNKKLEIQMKKVNLNVYDDIFYDLFLFYKALHPILIPPPSSPSTSNHGEPGNAFSLPSKSNELPVPVPLSLSLTNLDEENEENYLNFITKNEINIKIEAVGIVYSGEKEDNNKLEIKSELLQVQTPFQSQWSSVSAGAMEKRLFDVKMVNSSLVMGVGGYLLKNLSLFFEITLENEKKMNFQTKSNKINLKFDQNKILFLKKMEENLNKMQKFVKGENKQALEVLECEWKGNAAAVSTPVPPGRRKSLFAKEIQEVNFLFYFPEMKLKIEKYSLNFMENKMNLNFSSSFSLLGSEFEVISMDASIGKIAITKKLLKNQKKWNILKFKEGNKKAVEFSWKIEKKMNKIMNFFYLKVDSFAFTLNFFDYFILCDFFHLIFILFLQSGEYKKGRKEKERGGGDRRDKEGGIPWKGGREMKFIEVVELNQVNLDFSNIKWKISSRNHEKELENEVIGVKNEREIGKASIYMHLECFSLHIDSHSPHLPEIQFNLQKQIKFRNLEAKIQGMQIKSSEIIDKNKHRVNITETPVNFTMKVEERECQGVGPASLSVSKPKKHRKKQGEGGGREENDFNFLLTFQLTDVKLFISNQLFQQCFREFLLFSQFLEFIKEKFIESAKLRKEQDARNPLVPPPVEEKSEENSGGEGNEESNIIILENKKMKMQGRMAKFEIVVFEKCSGNELCLALRDVGFHSILKESKKLNALILPASFLIIEDYSLHFFQKSENKRILFLQSSKEINKEKDKRQVGGDPLKREEITISLYPEVHCSINSVQCCFFPDLLEMVKLFVERISEIHPNIYPDPIYIHKMDWKPNSIANFIHWKAENDAASKEWGEIKSIKIYLKEKEEEEGEGEGEEQGKQVQSYKEVKIQLNEVKIKERAINAINTEKKMQCGNMQVSVVKRKGGKKEIQRIFENYEKRKGRQQGGGRGRGEGVGSSSGKVLEEVKGRGIECEITLRSIFCANILEIYFPWIFINFSLEHSVRFYKILKNYEKIWKKEEKKQEAEGEGSKKKELIVKQEEKQRIESNTENLIGYCTFPFNTIEKRTVDASFQELEVFFNFSERRDIQEILFHAIPHPNPPAHPSAAKKPSNPGGGKAEVVAESYREEERRMKGEGGMKECSVTHKFIESLEEGVNIQLFNYSVEHECFQLFHSCFLHFKRIYQAEEKQENTTSIRIHQKRGKKTSNQWKMKINYQEKWIGMQALSEWIHRSECRTSYVPIPFTKPFKFIVNNKTSRLNLNFNKIPSKIQKNHFLSLSNENLIAKVIVWDSRTEIQLENWMFIDFFNGFYFLKESIMENMAISIYFHINKYNEFKNIKINLSGEQAAIQLSNSFFVEINEILEYVVHYWNTQVPSSKEHLPFNRNKKYEILNMTNKNLQITQVIPRSPDTNKNPSLFLKTLEKYSKNAMNTKIYDYPSKQHHENTMEEFVLTFPPKDNQMQLPAAPASPPSDNQTIKIQADLPSLEEMKFLQLKKGEKIYKIAYFVHKNQLTSTYTIQLLSSFNFYNFLDFPLELEFPSPSKILPVSKPNKKITIFNGNKQVQGVLKEENQIKINKMQEYHQENLLLEKTGIKLQKINWNATGSEFDYVLGGSFNFFSFKHYPSIHFSYFLNFILIENLWKYNTHHSPSPPPSSPSISVPLLLSLKEGPPQSRELLNPFKGSTPDERKEQNEQGRALYSALIVAVDDSEAGKGEEHEIQMKIENGESKEGSQLHFLKQEKQLVSIFIQESHSTILQYSSIPVFNHEIIQQVNGKLQEICQTQAPPTPGGTSSIIHLFSNTFPVSRVLSLRPSISISSSCIVEAGTMPEGGSQETIGKEIDGFMGEHSPLKLSYYLEIDKKEKKIRIRMRIETDMQGGAGGEEKGEAQEGKEENGKEKVGEGQKGEWRIKNKSQYDIIYLKGGENKFITIKKGKIEKISSRWEGKRLEGSGIRTSGSGINIKPNAGRGEGGSGNILDKIGIQVNMEGGIHSFWDSENFLRYFNVIHSEKQPIPFLIQLKNSKFPFYFQFTLKISKKFLITIKNSILFKNNSKFPLKLLFSDVKKLPGWDKSSEPEMIIKEQTCGEYSGPFIIGSEYLNTRIVFHHPSPDEFYFNENYFKLKEKKGAKGAGEGSGSGEGAEGDPFVHFSQFNYQNFHKKIKIEENRENFQEKKIKLNFTSGENAGKAREKEGKEGKEEINIYFNILERESAVSTEKIRKKIKPLRYVEKIEKTQKIIEFNECKSSTYLIKNQVHLGAGKQCKIKLKSIQDPILMESPLEIHLNPFEKLQFAAQQDKNQFYFPFNLILYEKHEIPVLSSKLSKQINLNQIFNEEIEFANEKIEISNKKVDKNFILILRNKKSAKKSDKTPKRKISVNLNKIKVKIQENENIYNSKEYLEIYLEKMKIKYEKFRNKIETMQILILNYQIDSKFKFTEFPVIFRPAAVPSELIENNKRNNQIKILGIIEKVENFTIIKCLSISVEKLILNIHDDFIYSLFSLFQIFSLRFSHFLEILKINFLNSESLNLDNKENSQELQEIESSVFIEKIHIKKIQMQLSVKASKFIFISLDKIPFEFDEFLLCSTGFQASELSEKLIEKYFYKILYSFPSILGSLEIFGNPRLLLQNLNSAFFQLLKLPLEGASRGPFYFVQGLSHGFSDFMMITSSSTLYSISNLSSSISRNLDFLSFDFDYLSTRNEKRFSQIQNSSNSTVQDKLVSAVKDFSFGMSSAVTGLFVHPFQSAQSSGFTGFFKGMGKGLIGAVTKPVGGAANLISQTSMAILQSVSVSSPFLQPITPPRTFLLSSSAWDEFYASRSPHPPLPPPLSFSLPWILHSLFYLKDYCSSTPPSNHPFNCNPILTSPHLHANSTTRILFSSILLLTDSPFILLFSTVDVLFIHYHDFIHSLLYFDKDFFCFVIPYHSIDCNLRTGNRIEIITETSQQFILFSPHSSETQFIFSFLQQFTRNELDATQRNSPQ